MKSSTLLKANITITLILAIGFSLLFTIYYHTFYENAMDRLESSATKSVSILYSELSDFFVEPLSISRTMAHDGFLISYLSSPEADTQPDFAATVTKYLQGFNAINSFDGVFLYVVSNGTVYTQDGKVASVADPSSNTTWCRETERHPGDYALNIDFDRTPSARYNPSLFINYKVFDRNRRMIGIVGVCVHLEKSMETLLEFERKTGQTVHIISKNGSILLSSHSTALAYFNLYELSGNKSISDVIERVTKNWNDNKADVATQVNIESQNYIAVKYIPELSWYIVVESYMGEFYQKIKNDIIKSGIVVVAILLSIILFISKVIYNFELKIKTVMGDRLRYFHDATRFLFSNIYEIDITGNRFAPESRMHQFALAPTPKELSYSKSLHELCRRVIKEEMQEPFLSTFSRENLLRQHEDGHDHVSLDCEVYINNVCQWLRYDAHIFTVEADQSVHMYLYAKDINEERQNEISARTDALTQCLSRGAAEELIARRLAAESEKQFAFFIIDIDNFKSANDTYGHMFGDECIKSFSKKIRETFRSDDIIGRFGGDEFVVFIPFLSEEWIHKKAIQLVKALDHNCVYENISMQLSGSVGIALSPKDGVSLEQLYSHADVALYEAKSAGKNTFYFYNMDYIYCPLLNE